MRVAAIAISVGDAGWPSAAPARAPPRTTRPRAAARRAARADGAARRRRPRRRARRPASRRPPKQFPKLRQASLLHKYQLGIAMLPGIGYRGIFPYQAPTTR